MNSFLRDLWKEFWRIVFLPYRLPIAILDKFFTASLDKLFGDGYGNGGILSRRNKPIHVQSTATDNEPVYWGPSKGLLTETFTNFTDSSSYSYDTPPWAGATGYQPQKEPTAKPKPKPLKLPDPDAKRVIYLD